METFELTRRVDRLEDLMADLTRKMDRLLEEMAKSRARSEQADETLRQELAKSHARSEQADETLRQELAKSHAHSEQADETLRQELAKSHARSEQNEKLFQQEMAKSHARSEQNEKLFQQEMAQIRTDAEEEYKKFRQDAEEEYKKFRRDVEEEHKNLRREMGQLSRKMGTLAEDLIAPDIPRLLKEVVGCTDVPRLIGVRMRLHHEGRSIEYDVVALCGAYLLINETKTKLQKSDIPEFIERLKEARLFLPEYADYQIVGALASFYIDSSQVRRGERVGIIMIGVGEGMMEVLNQPGFVPQTF